MRLTKTHREAFVSAVMNDVPKVDYQAQLEALIRAEERRQVAAISPKLLAVYDEKALRPYIGSRYCTYAPPSYYNSGLGQMSMCAVFKSELIPAEVNAAVLELVRQSTEQTKARLELENKIAGAIAACVTRKAAVDALPELAKYLPAEEPPKSRSVPMLINVVADLAQAGWPKGGVAA